MQVELVAPVFGTGAWSVNCRRWLIVQYPVPVSEAIASDRNCILLGKEVLQIGKEDVNIERIEPIGHYAVRLAFDDNHDSGLYSWDYLYELGVSHQERWQDYLDRLAAAGHQRRADS